MLKRIALFVLALCALLTLCACDDKEQRDVFFDSDMLKEYSLADIPTPSVENSRLITDTLYLNLSDEEFAKYISDVSEYLLAREDVYNVCYKEGESLDALSIREDYFTPLFVPYSSIPDGVSAVSLAFSLSPELGARGLMSETVRMDFIRGESSLSAMRFTYNTIMSFSLSELTTAYYDLCAALSHDWDETLEYTTPGSAEKLITRTCLRCGLEDRLCEPNTDGAIYVVRVREGSDKLAEPVVKRHKAGTLVEVLVTHNEGVHPMLTANGVMISPFSESDGVIRYRFLMPCEDVNISIMEFTTWPPVIEEEKTEFLLSELALWMAETEASDVVSVTVTDETAGAEPLSLVPHFTVTLEYAEALFDAYRNMMLIRTEDSVPDGDRTARTVTFTLTGGESHTVTLDGNIFCVEDTVYVSSDIPEIPEDALISTSYSFVSVGGACSVYANDFDNTYIGEIVDIAFLEFAPVSDEDMPSLDVTALIKTGCGDLLVLSDCIFGMISEDMTIKYYTVTNGSIFDFVD